MAAQDVPPVDERPRSATQERAEALRRSAAEAGAKSVTYLRPRVQQAWGNLRIWLPFFDTPNRRARQIRFSNSDCRDGFSWDVALPQQCCRCGRTDNLKSQGFETLVRAFEYPLHIAGVAGLMTAGVLLLAFMALTVGFISTVLSLLIFAAVIVSVAAGLLWLKSWDEDVRLRLFACPDHLAELREPEMVVHDNELTIVLPSESLAEAAMAELKQRRRGKHRGTSESTSPARPASGVTPPAAIPIGTPPLPTRPYVQDLPPIKLAGEDDEDPLP